MCLIEWKSSMLKTHPLWLCAARPLLSWQVGSCSAAALSFPCDITIAWRKVFRSFPFSTHAQAFPLDHTHTHARLCAHTHTLAESTLHLLYGCGSCCASKACRGVDIMTASANMRARLTRSQFENWLKAVGDEVSCARLQTRLWQRVMNSLCQSFSACICLDAGWLDSLGGSRSFQSDLLFI